MSKLYDLMNWRNIEGIIYSDISNPKSVLGIKTVKEGKLVGAFIPDARNVYIKASGEKKTYEMELMDEGGYYAALLPKNFDDIYKFYVEYKNGDTYEYYDPYQFDTNIPDVVLKKFNAGICYDVYKYLGAHKTTIKGVSGYRFAVWAPCADRVSVVGDFNQWDGRKHMMEKIEGTGVFSLFIPEITDNLLYKFEIRKKNQGLVLKSDPYGFYSELRPNTASITYDIDNFKWSDSSWIEKRAKKSPVKEPLSIYELHLGSWKKPKIENVDEGESFYNYRELAVMIAEYVKEMGYTHIELMPVMEHPLDESWGYQVTGYYSITSRYGTPEDFKYFIDYMHKEGIGVILDWVPAHFPKDSHGLARFDGTCLYEHADPRLGEHPDWGTLIFNYGRPEVSNFLIANAMFWVDEYHADGLRMDAVASMLYRDYGRRDGEWIPNIYGGNENLEAVEFFKHLNSQFKLRMKGALLIAEDSTAWPMMTGDVNGEGLGFDFKWNMGLMNDFLSYMSTDTLFRKNVYNQLTFSMIYQYSENFIVVFSHDEVTHGKGSMFTKMAGANDEEKLANLRATYAYMMTHPGKKLLFMGQDFAQRSEWNEKKALPWEELNNEPNAKINLFVKELNKLYLNEPALYEKDQEFEGFNWINCVSPSNSTVSFIRKGEDDNDIIFVVCNFDTVPFETFKVGVPKYGKYKEILNSDDVKFGGKGLTNNRAKLSRKAAYDGRENSITIALPALSVVIFKYEYVEEKKPAAKKKTVVKDTKKAETKSTRVVKSKIATELEKKIAKEADMRDKKETRAIKKVVEKKPAAKAKTSKAATSKTTTATKSTEAKTKKAKNITENA